MTSRFNRWLPILLVLFGLPLWWFLIDANRSDAGPKPVHIADLRLLADIIPGPHPTSVNYTLLATRVVPGDFFAAGIGLKRRPLAVVAWSLPVPGKGPIMIDPTTPPPAASVGEFKHFNRDGLNQIEAESRLASLVLYTQEKIGGPPRPPYQLGGQAGMSAADAAPMPTTRPGSFTTAQAVAPGVVVISASSHTPGADLIFVQLANHREFLFTGNISTLAENWSELRARSRLAADWGPPQNRAETYAWLRTIRRLSVEAPALDIVPGHDYLWLVKQRTSGAISEVPPSARARGNALAAWPKHFELANLR